MCILLGDAQDLPHVFAIGVRKFPAGLRSFAVNRAGVGLRLEEWARGRLQNPITVFVAAQVAAREIGYLHPEVLGDADNVALLENGAGGFAAVGTGQAINAAECRLVSTVKLSIQLTRGLAPPPCEYLLDGLAVACRPEQLPFVFVLQCGSWNAGFDVKDVSVNVCKKAISCACWTVLSCNPPVVYFIKGSTVVEGTPPEL